jgi:hypothetical protein
MAGTINFYSVRPGALPPRGWNVGDIFYVNGDGRELYQVQGDFSLVQLELLANPIKVNATFLQGIAVSDTAPTDGQVLRFNVASGEWEPAVAASGITAAQAIAYSIALS